MTPFFIAGLPRSRTAWLANFLTTDESFCYHELTADCCDLAEMPDAFRRTGRRIVGDADTSLALLHEPIKKLFPGARWVVVERPAEAVAKSLRDDLGIVIDPGLLNQLQENLEVIKRDALVVSFDGFSVNTARFVWAYCLPGIDFDEARWKLLDPLIVQLNPALFHAEFEARARNFEFLINKLRG